MRRRIPVRMRDRRRLVRPRNERRPDRIVGEPIAVRKALVGERELHAIAGVEPGILQRTLELWRRNLSQQRVST